MVVSRSDSCLRDSWESVVELQSQRARQQGQAEFENYISNTEHLSMPVDHAQLLQVCAAAKRIAFSTFDSICVSPNSRLRNLLKQHIHDRTHALREQNMEVSRSLAHREMLLQWNKMKDQCPTCVSALETVATLSSCVSLSGQGPGVWEGLGQCMIDVILPEVITMSRQFDFESSQARAVENGNLLKDMSICQMQSQELGHKVQQLQDSNNDLVQLRDRLSAEKAAIEELCAAAKTDLENKSRELQSLQVSSNSAKETFLQQLDASLKKNTSYAAQLHMLETDVQAAKARESDLQSSLQTLHDEHRDKEHQLLQQLEAAGCALEAESGHRQQARSREEDLKVECTVLKERLQNASDAAAADVASLQSQLSHAIGKARDAENSRDLLEASTAQREQQHSEEMRALMIESARKENALESKLFQQSQDHASIQQQLQEMTDKFLEMERRRSDSEALHQQLVQEHLSLNQLYSTTRAELERLSHVHQEIRSQHDQKMELLLQESSHNQQQLQELQQTLRKEQSVGQDAILAGTEVLQELARLKLQMLVAPSSSVFSCCAVMMMNFAERTRLTRRGLRAAKLLVARRPSQRVRCPFLQGDSAAFLFFSFPFFSCVTAAMIRRDSLKFQQLSSPQTPPQK
jgi:hypothetical protein